MTEKHMHLYGLLLLSGFLLIQGIEFCLEILNIRHMRKYGIQVPAGFEEHVTSQTLQKVMRYTIEKSTVSSVESVVGSAVILVFLFGGILDRYNAWITSLDVPFILQGLIFFLVLSLFSALLAVPFNLYGTFRIENKYGFNTMTARLWIADFVKSTAISAVLLSLVLSAALWIVLASPHYWWLFVWIFFFLFSITMMYVSPYIIEPLFHKFTPLEGHQLEDRIREMMQRTGIRVSRVFKIDASKRSHHTNAYFTGIGRVKRIVLYDTLLGKMNDDEVLAVLAHEAGHWKKKHVLKMIAAFELLSLAGAYLMFKALETDILLSVFQIRDGSFFAKLVLFGFVASIVSYPITPLFSFFSRRHENEADSYAVELASVPGALATSLIKLSKDNLSNLYPHPLYAKIHYSHPPVVERVKRLQARAGQLS